MIHGKVYLKLERRGNNRVVVMGTRTKKPDAPGVWVALDIVVPVSVFAEYEASLTIPPQDHTGVITALPAEYVPHCATHEQEAFDDEGNCDGGFREYPPDEYTVPSKPTPCVLEDPPRHIKLVQR